MKNLEKSQKLSTIILNKLMNATKKWNQISDQRQFFEKLKKTLKLKSWKDLKKVSRQDVIENGGSSILKYFGTIENAIQCIFPEFPKSKHDWPPKTKLGYWNDKSHQRNFLNKLFEKLQLKSWEDWHNVSQETIKKFGGSSLLNFYNGSIVKCLMTVYPEYEWKKWKFEKVPQEFWHDIKNRRNFFEDLAKKLNITHWENWYDVPSQIIREHGASGLIEQYGAHAVVSAYPEYDWQVWRFSRVYPGFWKKPENQRLFFEDLAKKIGIKTWEDWYRISTMDIANHGGSGLLELLYQNSFIRAITSVFKEYPWKIWKFEHVPKGYWDEPGNIKELFDWLQKELNIKKHEDWYLVTKSQLDAIGVNFAISKNGGLFSLLRKFYPDYDWDENKRNIIGKSQLSLYKSIQELFPQELLHMDFIHPALEFSNQEKMELDIFIPNLNLAFEYQGKQHFNQPYFITGDSKQHLLDIQKREACRNAGITLIEVPYWWNFSVKSLISLIKQHRPDLFKEVVIESQIIPTLNAGLQSGKSWK